MQKRVTIKTKRITIEGLAVMTARGFEDVEERLGKRIDNLGQEMREGFKEMRTEIRVGFSRMDAGFQYVNARLDTVRNDIADLDSLRGRVTAIETRIGLHPKE